MKRSEQVRRVPNLGRRFLGARNGTWLLVFLFGLLGYATLTRINPSQAKRLDSSPDWQQTDNQCGLRLQMALPSSRAAIRIDSVARMTAIYAADFQANNYVKFEIDSALSSSQSVLPIPDGFPRGIADLDADGSLEFVDFKGSASGIGVLRIYDMATWSVRDSFVVATNVVPATFMANTDSDPYVEIFLTIGDFASEHVQMLKYNFLSSGFEFVASADGILEGAGQVAGADFDNDGRFEYVRAGLNSYRVYEWTGTEFVSAPEVPLMGFGNHMVACHPFPDGVTYLLMGLSATQGPFEFRLMKAVADNTFEAVYSFFDTTGWSGGTPCYAADVDCDGLDELFLIPAPHKRAWEWDVASGQFAQSCSYDSVAPNGLYYWYSTDMDFDTRLEWTAISGGQQLYMFSSLPCQNCDPLGHCDAPEIECGCGCLADPSCDGVRSDVLDVVATIDVSFRGEGESPDPSPYCGVSKTDVNCTGSTDIVDVVKIINVAFRGAAADSEFCDPCSSSSSAL